MTAPDPDDAEHKFSIYIVYDVIKRAPENIKIANLAHELGHIYSIMQGTQVKPEDLLAHYGETRREIDAVKHEALKNLPEWFEEPVKSMIINMEDEKVKKPHAGRQYVGDSRGLAEANFLETVLGKKQANQLVNSKVKEAKCRLGLE
jgi:L-lactate utilization protein LutB